MPRREPPKRARSIRQLQGDRVHPEVPEEPTPAFQAVYELVRRIPKGRVMTYGQIATVIANRLSPRAVGWALHGCPEDVPWQRVVNAQGRCSTDRLAETPTGLQQSLLEREGVRFNDSGRLDLDRYRWSPPPARAKRRKRSSASSARSSRTKR